ncbi:hypothetical protein J2X53_002352 [Pseudorhodobacter sp. 4114]|nr:hypothetical protein [Pseudorhodobacter sp. 4114]
MDLAVDGWHRLRRYVGASAEEFSQPSGHIVIPFCDIAKGYAAVRLYATKQTEGDAA